MKTSFLYFIFLVSSSYCQEVSSHDDLKLELVQVIFRHGARTPVQLSLDFYTTINQSIYEPWNVGVLTDLGKQQAYNLGLFLRNHYKDYLSVDYKAEELYAYSSDEDRAKMAMEILLAGLYPPTGVGIWNPSLLWSPVPFKSVPLKFDFLLRGYESSQFEKYHAIIRNSIGHKTELQKIVKTLSFLDEKTGVNATSSFFALWRIFDVLYCNEYMNMTMPDWYTPEVRKTLVGMLDYLFDYQLQLEEMRKIGISFFIRTLAENMNLNKTKNNPRKMYLYSGHELNLAWFQKLHNTKEYVFPHFGNALLFEKWRNSKDEVYVRLLAWTGTEELLNLQIVNHENFCPIEDYLKISTPHMASDSDIDNFLGQYSVPELKNILFEDTVVKEMH